MTVDGRPKLDERGLRALEVLPRDRLGRLARATDDGRRREREEGELGSRDGARVLGRGVVEGRGEDGRVVGVLLLRLERARAAEPDEDRVEVLRESASRSAKPSQ